MSMSGLAAILLTLFPKRASRDRRSAGLGLSYAGRIGCEYNPRGDTVAGLAWAKPYLQA